MHSVLLAGGTPGGFGMAGGQVGGRPGGMIGGTQSYGATSLMGLTVSPRNVCGCATSNGITEGYGTAPSSCTSCPDSSTAKSYIVVDAHVCYSTLFTWPGLTYGGDGCGSNKISLTAQSFVLK